MTAPHRGPDDEILDERLEQLEPVSLRFFTGNPTSLGPFDSSQLRWGVDGVKPGVQIKLNNTTVLPTDQRWVRPPSSSTYVLSAVAGPARKSLGNVHLTVDESSCVETEILGAFRLMRTFLASVIANNPDTYWVWTNENVLTVKPANGGIAVRMVFRLRIPSVPDLIVTVNASFGLTVENGQFVAINEDVSAEVEWPTWFWFLSGILGGLALALNDANGKATERAQEVVTGLVAYLNLLRQPDQFRRVRSVWIGNRDGMPKLFYTQCSYLRPDPNPHVEPGEILLE